MDLGFTDDQETLRESARAFVEGETRLDTARSLDHETIHQVWESMTSLGWPGVAIPADEGGAGMSVVELAILLEETGRGLVPGPLLATAGLFAPALLEMPTSDVRDRLLRAAATGSTGALALAEVDGSWSWETMETTARRDGANWILSGTKQYVVDGENADEILVVARGDAGLGVFAVPGNHVSRSSLESFDPTLRLATIRLDEVCITAEREIAAPGTGVDALTRSLQTSLVAVSALIVGACGSVLDRTIEYAKTREQFDQPIGSFQAVKHKLADMYVAVERARSLVYFAALTICENDGRRDVAASMAKAAAGDCQRLVVQDGLQLHGGIGFTWEFDLHMFLKRASALEALLGSSRFHRRRIAEKIDLV